MIDTLVRKYMLPAVLGFSLSMPAYAQKELPEMSLEQIAACQNSQDCYYRGKEEFGQGQYERAEAFFRRANSLASPGKSKTIMLYNMGSICLIGNKVEKAQEYFQLYLDENIEQVQTEMSTAPSRAEINSVLVGIGLYQEGMNFFARNKFAESIVLYTRAQHYFEEHPELALSALVATSLHLPLGKAYDKAGKFSEAHREYQLYVDTAPVSPETHLVKQRIAELDKLLASKKEENVVPVKPHLIIPPPIVVSPPPKSFFQQHKWSLLTASGAAALGVGALVNHLGANANYQDLRDRCEKNNSCSPADADSIKTKDTITAILGLGSALALGTAGVLFYFERPEYVPTPTANGVEWRVRF